MSKSKASKVATAETPILPPVVTSTAATAETPKFYTMRLPTIYVKARPSTYIVQAGPLGVERWLSKKAYNVQKDADGYYAILTQAQADYYLKTLPADCAYMPTENKA